MHADKRGDRRRIDADVAKRTEMFASTILSDGRGDRHRVLVYYCAAARYYLEDDQFGGAANTNLD